MPKKTLFLIDGNAFFYRAFYAIRDLATTKGVPTNAIYGFITIMDRLMKEYGPDHMVICFDSPGKTFRHDRYDKYKANRKPMPEDLADQIEPIKEFCEISKFVQIAKPAFEADDLIGTLAKRGEKEGYKVMIATGDKDALQLVTENISIVNIHKEGLIYTPDKVQEKFGGLGPESVVDVMALMGDASDNIPGVPGVGEKTAIKLIKKFESIDRLEKEYDKIPSKRHKTLVEENLEKMVVSKDLATIDCDVEMDIALGETAIQPPDYEKLAEFYKRYEFNRLLRDLPEGTEGVTAPVVERKTKYQTVTEKDWESFLKNLEKRGSFSFDTETTSSDPMKAELVGMSFSWKAGEAYYLPVSGEKHEGPGMDAEKVLEALRPTFENKDIDKYGHNIKYDEMVMKRQGITLKGITFDTMIASYLVNPVKRNHNLDDVSLEYLGIQKTPTDALLGKGKKQITMDQAPLEEVSKYACEDADCVWQLVSQLRVKLKELELESLCEDVEMPLAEVLGITEANGVLIDVKFLNKLSADVEKDLEALRTGIYDDAGEEFNLDSPKQLAEVLFEKKGFPAGKKTKGGAKSTDSSVLEKLALKYELPKMLLEYREKTKLKSTYLDALPEMVNPETGLVHTSYNQTTTDTGRLSSTEPNLQNIPIKTELGRMVRKAFVSRFKKGGSILSADYSQIELRILAHFSADENLMKAFNEDLDIHSYTATLLYDVEEKDVTREMRNAAKTINFSIIYGKTSYGLAGDLNMSIGEADSFIKNYFDRYAGIKEFLDGQKEKAKEEGFLRTLLGRRSYFPQIHSKNMHLRNYAERAAINAPIQGSAADLIKLAMIDAQKALEKKKLKSKMIMQVHDELVFDVPGEELDEMKGLVREVMEDAYALNVPLKADVTIGESWFKS